MIKTQNNVITSAQLFILLFTIKISIIVLDPYIAQKNDLLTDILIPFLIIIIVYSLSLITTYYYDKYNGKTIITPEIYSYIYIIVSGYFCILFLIRMFSFCQCFLSDEINDVIIVISLFSAAVYGAKKGIEGIARYSFLLFILIIIAIITIVIFLYPSYNNDNLKPVNSEIIMNSGSGLVRLISGSPELIVLLLCSPYSKDNIKKSGISWLFFLSVFVCFMLILLSGALGVYLSGPTFPYFRITDASGPLQRLNPMFIVILISSAICLISSFLYIIRQNIRSIYNSESIFWIIAVSVLVLSILLKDNSVIFGYIYNYMIRAIIIIISIFIMPAMLLILKKLKKINQKIILLKKLSIVFIITISISTILSGCNSTQLNQRMIVQGIGIDKIEDQYEITLIMLDTEAESSENSLIIKSFPGKTTEQAIKNSENITGKKILLSQCLFIMLNNQAGQELDKAIQYFADNNEIMKTTNIMISEDSSKKTIETAIEKLNYHSEDINVISDSNTTQQPVSHFTVFDYIVNRKNKYNTMVIPVIKYNRIDDILYSSDSVIIDELSMNSMELNESETLSFLILNNRINNITLNNNNSRHSLTLNYSDTKIKPKITNNRLSVIISIYTDLNKPQDRTFLYEQIDKSMKKIINNNGYDIIGIYNKLSDKDIKSVKPGNWKQMLKESLITLKVMKKKT